ncbi:MAG TPA: phosphoadenylyl-sulfate reductase [Actinomycetota bacterium]|nr:phosphoadenylyl-sulfate reductase [Actinomycetota bacterium]
MSIPEEMVRAETEHPHPTFASPSGDYELQEDAHPSGILEWATATIERLAVATSFQSSGLVILHLLKEMRPDVPVLFLNTGWHFQETLDFGHDVATRWNLNLVELRGTHGSSGAQDAIHGPELYERDPEKCCFINKVAPLQDALENYDGWISGIRRDQSPLRAHTPIVEAQLLPTGNELLKIHPLANWDKAQVADYLSTHDIPTHPLLEKGYTSIGCWPCTRAIHAGEDERAGRWEGFSKSECGIHSFGKPHGPKETEAEQ